jgi:hypothetical protein
MGINEFSGYLSIAVVAFVTGWMAKAYGVRPYPFVIGILFAVSFTRKYLPGKGHG